MKKLFTIIIVVMLLTTVASAQTKLGIRGGDVSGGNFAVDGIISIGS